MISYNLGDRFDGQNLEETGLVVSIVRVSRNQPTHAGVPQVAEDFPERFAGHVRGPADQLDGHFGEKTKCNDRRPDQRAATHGTTTQRARRTITATADNRADRRRELYISSRGHADRCYHSPPCVGRRWPVFYVFLFSSSSPSRSSGVRVREERSVRLFYSFPCR